MIVRTHKNLWSVPLIWGEKTRKKTIVHTQNRFRQQPVYYRQDEGGGRREVVVVDKSYDNDGKNTFKTASAT